MFYNIVIVFVSSFMYVSLVICENLFNPARMSGLVRIFHANL